MHMKKSNIQISTAVTVTAMIAISISLQLFSDETTPKAAHASYVRSSTRFQSYNAGTNFPPTTQELRYEPTTRPGQPEAQFPPQATTQNTDTGKPPHEWQRLTDDWGGIRPKLEDRGITIDGSIAGYFGKNLTGGISTGKNGGAYLLNLNATLDSKKLVGYDGGTFFLNFRNEDGIHHSFDGAFGNTSHLYEPARTEISEAWYEQQLLENKLRIRVGKIDANTEFANNSNGAEFLNDFGGYSPTILAFPTDPDPAFGIDAFIYPTPHLYAGAGIYDGSLAEGRSTGELGPANALHPDREFMIAEIGGTWTASGGRDGKLGIGVWHHTAQFAKFDGGTQNGATGPYVTLDQMLWRSNPADDDDKRGIALFSLAGYSDPSISAAHYQVGGGLKWTGAIMSRPEDIIGLGVDYIRLSTAAGSGFDRPDETTIETFYKIRLNPWFSVQPDMQYIHNPGGVSDHHDALALTVQALVDF
jgi:porin